MWGILGGKDKDKVGTPPSSDAPPPMMFNPAMASTSYKPKTSRNPLARPKRPSGSGFPPSTQGQSTQPLSPTSPVSPNRAFNTFPNFHGSENANSNSQNVPSKSDEALQRQTSEAFQTNEPFQRQESSDISTSEQVSQYLQNYEYGEQEPHIAANNGEGATSVFHENDGSRHLPMTEETGEDSTEQHNAQGAQEYKTEDEFNFAYFQYYQQNPPPGQWDAYKQQWEEYYHSLGAQQLSYENQEHNNQQNFQESTVQSSQNPKIEDHSYNNSHGIVEPRQQFPPNDITGYPTHDVNTQNNEDYPPVSQNQAKPVSENAGNTLNAGANYQLSNVESQSPRDRDSVTPLWDKKDLILPRSEDVDPEGNIIMQPASYTNNAAAPDIGRSRTSSSRTISENHSESHRRFRTTSSTSQSHASDVLSGGGRSRKTSTNSFINEVAPNTNILPPPQFEDPPQDSQAPFSFGTYGSAFAPLPKMDEPSSNSGDKDIITAFASVNANFNSDFHQLQPYNPAASSVDGHKKTETPQSFTASSVGVQNPDHQTHSKPENNAPIPVSIPTSSAAQANFEQTQQHSDSIHPNNIVNPVPPVFPAVPQEMPMMMQMPAAQQPQQMSHQPPMQAPLKHMNNSHQQSGQIPNQSPALQQQPTSLPQNSMPPPQKTVSPSQQSSLAPLNQLPQSSYRNTMPTSHQQIMPSRAKEHDNQPAPLRTSNYDKIGIRRPNESTAIKSMIDGMDMGLNEVKGANDNVLRKLRKEYEDTKIIVKSNRATPDSFTNIPTDGLGTPLMNSTKVSRTAAMIPLKNCIDTSVLAQQEAYENVRLQCEEGQQTYENHDFIDAPSSKPPLPPRPNVPPRIPRREGASRAQVRSAQGNYPTHKRTHSGDSANSFKSDRLPPQHYESYRSDRSRHSGDRSEASRYNENDPRFWDERKRREMDFYAQRRYWDYEMRRRAGYEWYLRSGGYNPDEYFRGYDPYGRRGHYRERSDEISISNTESARSEAASNDDAVESSDIVSHDITDTDNLLDSEDGKSNLDITSAELKEETSEDDVVKRESEEEEEEVPVTALADLYTAPYLYTRYHVRAACFGANKVVIVRAGDDDDADDTPPSVDISDYQHIYWKEAKELEKYPGPCIKGETPKRDVMSYCKKQVEMLRNSEDNTGKVLLWDLLYLLCKQNGVVVGTDVAELLLHDHKLFTASKDPADDATDTEFFIGDNRSSVSSYSSGDVNDDVVSAERREAMSKIRDCLFEGQRKEALEVSVKYKLWAEALVIGTTLSHDVMISTMQKYALDRPKNDPLRTFNQLVSHTEPTACSGINNWREHLAMMLSNQSDKYDANMNYVMNMGNTLAKTGMTAAAHFCFLMAGVKLTSVRDKTSPISLLGFDHTVEEFDDVPFEAIHSTEIYEYSRQLGGDTCLIPFQAVKLYYARQVAKVGQYQKALGYLHQISNNVVSSPKCYRARFIRRVYEEVMRLMCLLNPAVKTFPEWVATLQETLNIRQLGLSERSTGYSSRVDTPDIQKVAHYLLQKNSGDGGITAANGGSTGDKDTGGSQQTTAAVQQPASEEPSHTTQMSAEVSAQQQEHDSLLANGFTFDGTVYWHQLYPGYYYYCGNWYEHVQSATTQQQPEDSNNNTNSGYHDNNNTASGYHDNNNLQLRADYQQQSDPSTSTNISAGQRQDSGESDNHQSYHSNINQSYHSNINQSNIPDPSCEDAIRPKTEQEVDSVFQHRERLDTLTNENSATEVVGEEAAPPLSQGETGDEGTKAIPVTENNPPPLTFFNPSQFGTTGGSLMAPLVPTIIQPPQDHPLSDEEIKTPTNDPTSDSNIDNEIDEDSLYAKKKPKSDGEQEKTKAAPKPEPKSGGGGLFSRIFGREKRMNLPDDSQKSIYWDDNLGKYVNLNADENEEDDTPPPPTSLPSSNKSSISGASGEMGSLSALSAASAPPSPGGSFRRKPGRSRLANRYVDVMGGSGMKKSATTPSLT